MKILKITFIITILMPTLAFALEDDLKKAIEISIHGGKFQAERLKVAAENLANEDSVSDSPGGNPYRRKTIFARNDYDKKLKTRVVTTKKVDVDKSDFIRKYEPSHPAADADGYVKYPNVQKEIERADASEAQRSYEAGLGVIEMSRSMMQSTVEAIK